jgi:hypothetical protein
MDFGLTEEQDQLAAAERAWLTKSDPVARVRATLDASAVTVDRAAVAHAVESGLLELLTPEIGGTHVDLAVVSEEHGYAASSLPVADLSIAAWLLDSVGVPHSEGALLGVAFFDGARVDGGTLHLTGTSSPVPMAADMETVVVTGVVDQREYLAVVTPPTTSAMTTLDLTRSWARLRLDVTTDDWTELPQGNGRPAARRAGGTPGVRRAGRGGPVARHDGVPTPDSANSSACRSARSRPSSITAPTWWSLSKRAGRHCGPRPSRWTPRLLLHARERRPPQRHTRNPPPPRWPARRCRCTAASASPGEHDLHLFLRRIKVDEGVQRERRRTPRGAAHGLTEILGASLGLRSGVSPSRLSLGPAGRSERSRLSVDVLLDDGQGFASAGDGEVGRDQRCPRT